MLDGVVNNMTEEEEKLRKIKKIQDAIATPPSIIKTNNHFLVGTKWSYAKGIVTMHEEGFSCTCKKKPRVSCNHIKNVKLRLYGTFDEHYVNV